MRKPIFSNKEVADMASGMGNVMLGLACLVLIPYLAAPLFSVETKHCAFLPVKSLLNLKFSAIFYSMHKNTPSGN